MNNKIITSLIIVVVFIGGVFWILSNKKGEVGAPIDVNQSPIIIDGNIEPGSTENELPVEPAAASARKDLATKLLVSEKSIVIMQITDTTWNDGCLGLGGPAESCLQALTPGFRVEMLAKGKTYFYRTDKTGDTLRTETQ